MDKMLDTIGRLNRTLPDKTCAECGKIFRPRGARSKYCSRPCMWKNNGGQNRKAEAYWRKTSKGYIAGTVWKDGKRVHARQHRWLMEWHLGRPLLPDEDVHHRNGIKDDNRLENLEVINHAKHTTLSNLNRKRKNDSTQNPSR